MKDIEKDETGYKIIFRQKKTKDLEYFQLSNQAYALLGDPSKDQDLKIFAGLKYTTDAYYKLQKWAIQSGMN
ncbi:MAG: hypothetical protein IPL53_08495 [Ignavibacteria bacterium]|nr:hypothetical protein [Ignavibacteria bacterium]